MNVNELIASLRQTIEGARSMPMSASAVINRSEVLDLVERLEEALPAAFADSERVVSERDSVVADARAEAAQIIADAQQERDDLVSETEVYRLARTQAEQVRDQAVADGEALRQETDEYVDGRLANFEVTLNKTLEAVARGRDRLHGRSDLTFGDSAEPAEPVTGTAADAPAADVDASGADEEPPATPGPSVIPAQHARNPL